MNTTLTTATALEARAAWSTITEPGDATAGALTRHAGHTAALEALAAGRDTLLAALTAADIDADEATQAAARWLPRHNPRHTEQALALAARHGITLIDPATGEQGCEAAERHLVTLGARARRAHEDARSWLRTALEEIGTQKIRHPGNHRYAWALGTARQRRRQLIALEQTPYPKAARDLLQRIPIGA